MWEARHENGARAAAVVTGMGRDCYPNGVELHVSMHARFSQQTLSIMPWYEYSGKRFGMHREAPRFAHVACQSQIMAYKRILLLCLL
jgi:hypothetical protein